MPFTSRRIHIAVVILSWVLVSCRTPRPTTPAPCVTEKTNQLAIRWGTQDDSLRVIDVYRMNTKGEIFHYSGPITQNVVDEYLLHIDQSDYCASAASVNACFLKTQALNTAGRKGRFIEYFNPTTDVYLRAAWNPELQTFQSRDMRKEYDQLMSLVTK
ncbi:MAG: hypothetical protein RIR53_316 [Bacteroidota bacterium]|jgi:hypothetical protein